MQWLAEHWGIITMVAIVLLNALNALTMHYSSHTGWKRAVLWLAERALTVVASADAPARLKWPWQDAKPGPRLVP